MSTVLTPCKSRYPHYQKIAYAVFMASRKLRHYFQECSITVASEVPLNDIINNRDATGRIAKWAIDELVYVKQPPGFEDPYFPDHVYQLDKALYGQIGRASCRERV